MNRLVRQYGEPMTRYCVQHQDHAPTAGGKYLILNEGKARRWMCAKCLESTERRKKQE